VLRPIAFRYGRQNEYQSICVFVSAKLCPRVTGLVREFLDSRTLARLEGQTVGARFVHVDDRVGLWQLTRALDKIAPLAKPPDQDGQRNEANDANWERNVERDRYSVPPGEARGWGGGHIEVRASGKDE